MMKLSLSIQRLAPLESTYARCFMIVDMVAMSPISPSLLSKSIAISSNSSEIEIQNIVPIGLTPLFCASIHTTDYLYTVAMKSFTFR